MSSTIERSSIIPLIIFTVIWITSSVSQVVLVKHFQLILHPQLPYLLADLAAAGFVLILPIYIFFCIKVKGNTLDLLCAPYKTGRMKYHFLGGFFTALQLISISFALQLMPGSTFTVVRGSELLITLTLSMVLFGKHYNKWHYLGVLAMLVGGILVSEATSEESHQGGNVKLGYHIWRGVFVAFAGVAFASSAQAIVTEWIYQKNILIKARYDHLNEVSLYTMFFTFILLAIFTFFFSGGEYRLWSSTLAATLRSKAHNGHWIGFLGLLCSRAIAMTTKVGVTVHSDAMFNRSLTTVRRAAQITMMAVLFRETISPLAGVGIVVSLIASGIYTFAGEIEKKLLARRLPLLAREFIEKSNVEKIEIKVTEC